MLITGNGNIPQDYFFIEEAPENEIAPLKINITKAKKADGSEWDQTNDAAEHMKYAHTLGLPELFQVYLPRRGTAIIVGGAPSITAHLEQIRELSKDKRNYLFALNWTHTWLINHGIIPNGTVFFEIDAEPGSILKTAHPDVIYYICSHCHRATFDQLKDFKRVLWHPVPGSTPERQVKEELFTHSHMVSGGVGTFTRTMTIAMFLGYRDFEIFGCDSSFPEGKTHVDGYETPSDLEKDSIDVYAKFTTTNQLKKFRTIPSLALQVEEFKEFCLLNHGYFTMRCHGNGLLPWTHRQTYPSMYEEL